VGNLKREKKKKENRKVTEHYLIQYRQKKRGDTDEVYKNKNCGKKKS